MPASVQGLWRNSNLSFIDEILKKWRLEYTYPFDRESLWENLLTPRRLTVFVQDLEEKQQDEVKTLKGPSASVAFDSKGNPTQAALGFAKSKGLNLKDIKKGDDGYVYAKIKTEGRPTKEVLPEVVKEIISEFASKTLKTMRWGPKDVRFSRPIRWILAIYGNDVIQIEIDGIKSGNTTYGHRFLSGRQIQINKIDDLKKDYIDKLDKESVIVEFGKRRKNIENQINKICKTNNLKPANDEYEQLLSEVTSLVEFPTAVLGSFDKKYLKLPRQVLETSMRSHQRYFPLEYKDSGKLAPNFIVVHNGSTKATQTVVTGNERVLTARLEDAHFFYFEDIKKPIISFIPKLKGLVFHSALGTMAQKAGRIELLAKEICNQLGIEKRTSINAIRAAAMCKADLVTSMVVEFPNLQGVMGREYAFVSKENKEIAEAIYEHYLPKGRYGKSANLPKTKLGQIIALADKIDSAASLLSVERPTASRDPYGIRRQLTGAVRIAVEKQVPVNLVQLIKKSLDSLDRAGVSMPYGGIDNTIIEFLDELRDYKEQLWEKELLRDNIEKSATRPWAAKAVVQPVIEKVKKLSDKQLYKLDINLLELYRMIETLDEINLSQLEDITTSFIRCNNLSDANIGNKINETLLETKEEKTLYKKIILVENINDELIDNQKFSKYLSNLAQLRKPVDEYFESVLIMSKDKKIRNNRIAILNRLVDIFISYADFSFIKGGGIESA